MNANRLQAAAEAILFASGEPLEVSKLAQILEVDDEQMEQVLENLGAQLDERQAGISLLKLNDKYQLATRVEFSQQVRDALEVKKNAPLSPAAFEVLAVIAYNQPVTKSFIEEVRGVDCSGVVATLCQKGLIEEKGRLELPGRPLLYGTTSEFLRCFSISSLEELPPLPQNDAGDQTTFDDMIEQADDGSDEEYEKNQLEESDQNIDENEE
ncbi:MAG: SMC-Scp complex subunit ScpB [Clostridiales bacterium]|nr:SMC-Scp complex subunit ScpB [Clostridiales bacterium]